MKHAWLFDIDGVLCEPQQKISKEMTIALGKLRHMEPSSSVPFVSPNAGPVYLVTGNSYTKAVDMTDSTYKIFANNADELRIFGSLLWHDTETPPLPDGMDMTLSAQVRKHEEFANNRIEWRSPRFVNYCPVGRFADRAARDAHDTSWRDGFIAVTSMIFPDVEYALGGQVSVDIYSKGADKSRAGKWLNDNGYTFTFIGDKTAPGGNDYPLAEYCRLHPENKCYTSTGPQDTLRILGELK